METPAVPEVDLTRLAPGTQVGPWRVVSWSGEGTYGTVYRAVSSGQTEPVPVALKVARNPFDPRFSREAALLSQLSHPSVPLLLDHGRWRSPSGAIHPYLTMEWVEGTPLYDWAEEHAPTSRQVLQLLGHLLRALQTIHAAGAVHRDVKGGNVLVGHEDMRAVLTDFGSANYRGAARLTWQTQPPGTPGYRSPEAWEFLLRFGLASDEHYLATPADDVFALGVTAYRLVTGQYPPSPEPGQEEARAWEPDGPGPKPPRELNPRVEPTLSGLILRMLALSPEARGTAKELAEAVERASEGTSPDLELPLSERKPTQRIRPQNKASRKLPWLASATGGLVLAVWGWQTVSLLLGMNSGSAGMGTGSAGCGPDTVAVGDSSTAAASSSSEVPTGKEPVAAEAPDATFQGQAEPDARGRCPLPEHVVIDSRCWVKQAMAAEPCEKSGYIYVQGKCYAPVFSTRRRPTSNPPDSR
jgi:serine/threonine protein kinase